MFLISVGALIVVLGVLIFVHEAGHFIAAKAMGIQVLRFSLGFGRPVISVRRGETEYAISWLPLGGYVKMAGLEDEGFAGELEGGKMATPVDPDRAFDRKPIWQRLVVILAGVTMNMIFAFVTYSVLAYAGALKPDQTATTTVDSIAIQDLPAGAKALATLGRGDRIATVNGDSVATWGDLIERIVTEPSPVRLGVSGRSEPLVLEFAPGDTTDRLKVARSMTVFLPPIIAQVQPGGAGALGGMRPGDRILRAGADSIRSWQEFVNAVRSQPERHLPIVVLREGTARTLDVVPEKKVETDPTTNEQRTFGMVGVVAERPVLSAPGAVGAVRLGWRETSSKVSVILLFLRRPRMQELGGPLTIGQVSGQAARVGFAFFLGFMAFLSVNLAVLNLLPIPILDGGQVVFLVAEAIRRRPLSVQLRARLTQVGFAVLVGIMLLAFRNDVLRMFPHVISR